MVKTEPCYTARRRCAIPYVWDAAAIPSPCAAFLGCGSTRGEPMVCHARARVFLAELLSLNGSGAFNNLGWTTGFVWAGDTPAAGYHYTVVLP